MTERTNIKRIIIAVTLSAALILTGIAGFVSVPSAQAGSAAADSIYAYAVTTPGAVTPPPVTPPAPLDIATATVTGLVPLTYTGKALKPKPIVTLGGKTLKLSRDYTLSYQNNKLPGKASSTIKAKGSAYTGQKIINFLISLDKPTKLSLKVTKSTYKDIKIDWRAADNITGYQVVHASNLKFTKQKKRKKIEGQKESELILDNPYYKRSYYVKVRSYKTIGDKTYYSEFTPVKKLNTKDLKWIEIDISKQKTYLKKGKKTVKKYLISSGKAATPTHLGTYYVYKKLPIRDMHGWDPVKKEWYDAFGVRWVAYFNGGEAFHACTWHSNWGTPMSHGCINMKPSQAKELYKWTPVGTKVEIHK
jgi:lipoprotein-anchoring transpeptidase ErfK/SrfK